MTAVVFAIAVTLAIIAADRPGERAERKRRARRRQARRS